MYTIKDKIQIVETIIEAIKEAKDFPHVQEAMWNSLITVVNLKEDK